VTAAKQLVTKLVKLPSALIGLLVLVKERLIAALQEVWFSEPTAVIAGAVAAVTAVASALGVVLHQSTAELIVTVLIPIAVGALARRTTTSTKAGRVFALARAGTHRHVISVHFWRRTALLARRADERLQAAALAEGGSGWPPTDEPERQTLYARFAGAVTPSSKLEVRKATHSERGRWVVLVVGQS